MGFQRGAAIESVVPFPLKEPPVARDHYVLWRFMIDKEHQRKGYSKEILDEAVKYVKTEPCGESGCIWLSYEPENIRAKRIYQKYGFQENGEYCGEEIVAVLEL